MINPSSSGTGGGGDAGSSGIQFRMTVKVDIEGQIPASSSASDAQSVCAAAASSSTQDLLLKLQPLLPHICIAKSSAASTAAAEEAAAQETPPAVAEKSGDDSGLELSLGLSLFRTKSGVAAAENPENLPENARARQDLSGGGQEQAQVLQRRVSDAAAAMAEWRTSEEQRLKREAQCQKRQEARKKRRILIDEQKLQRKSAAKSSSSSAIKSPARRSASEMINTLTNTMSGSQDHRSENAGERMIRSNSSSSSRCRRKLPIKSEVEDQIVRPDCSSGSSEWVQKFLEMQKMVPSESMNSRSDEQQQQQQQLADDESVKKNKNRLMNFGPPLSLPPSNTSSISSSMASFPSTVSSSFTMPPPVSPSKVKDFSQAFETKVQEFSQDTDTKNQDFLLGVEQVQDHLQAPAPPVQDNFQAPQVLQAPQVEDPLQQAPRVQDCAPLQECNRNAVLLRSTSVEAGYRQQKHSIQMPSPVRCSSSSNNSSLMRTLSEGAAMRAMLMNKDEQRHFCWRRTRKQEQQPPQQNKPGSAFKSPKKEVDASSNIASGSGSGATPGQVHLPWVTTTGAGPDGKTVSGVLLAYKKGDVRIFCACHGQHFTPKEFVMHAGGGEVSNPEKYIVVSPARRLSFNSPR